MSTVELKSVGKSYGAVKVVNDVSLSIRDGEFMTFLGPSGCGKTTCLRMIAGLERNTSGTILLDGETVSDPASRLFVAPEKRRIGMVFQTYAVWPHMNVFDNVAYPLRVSHQPKDVIQSKVMKTLAMVELAGLEKRMPSQLSGGQQQRVALARGLAMEPRVLLLDEPLSNLDAKLREKMRGDIRRIQKELKITVVLVTHDQIEANTMSDRIVILNKGTVLQVGTPDEIHRKPADEFVADFIRA